MTRKDFELIAYTLFTVKPAKGLKRELAQWVNTVETFAERLHGTNPNFNTGRFYRAAGLVEED